MAGDDTRLGAGSGLPGRYLGDIVCMPDLDRTELCLDLACPGYRLAPPVSEQGQSTARTATADGTVGLGDLSAGALSGDGRCARKCQHALTATRLVAVVGRYHTDGGGDRGQHRARAVPVSSRRGMELVRSEQFGRARSKLCAQDGGQRDRPPARLDDGDGLCRGKAPTPAPRHQPKGRWNRPDGPQVWTGADDDLGPGFAECGDRRLEMAERV